MKLSIEINGHSLGDLESALAEVARLLSQGNEMGQNENDTADFQFDVEGESIEYYLVASEVDSDEPKKHFIFDDARDAANGDDVLGYDENGSLVMRFDGL